MTTHSLYKEVLMDHYRHPRNKGDLKDADRLSRGSNPRCGDDIEIGVTLRGDTVEKVSFRGRGCSVCLASASMLTEVVSGKQLAETHALCREVQSTFTRNGENDLLEQLGDLAALSVVRQYPARHRCVLLSWSTLSDALCGL
jgi:nitrogen fixation NifU-like protein